MTMRGVETVAACIQQQLVQWLAAGNWSADPRAVQLSRNIAEAFALECELEPVPGFDRAAFMDACGFVGDSF